MRKKLFSLITILFFIVLLVPILAFAAADVTFEWDGNTESDLAGYRIYQSDISGVYVYGEGSPNLVKTLERGPNPGGTETVTIQVEEGICFWVFTAYDNEIPSLESEPSNEVTKKISFAPAPPQNIIITLIKKIIAWIMNLFKPFRFA